MFDGSIAFLLWRVDSGPFPNLTAPLIRGLLSIGVEKALVAHLHGEPRPETNWPTQTVFYRLHARRARAVVPALIQFLHDVRPSIVISMGRLLNIPAILAKICSAGTPTKFVITEHSTYTSYRDGFMHGLKTRLSPLPLLTRVLYPRADGFVAVTEEVLDDYHHARTVMSAQRRLAIPNPLDVPNIQMRARMIPSHPWLREKIRPVIVSVGRLVPEKSHALLLDAFGMALQKVDLGLVILGRGPLEKRLRNLVRERGLENHVDFAGWRDNPWCEVAQADLFVHPSAYETFGLAIAEAMACGVPVVATDALGGGPRYILGGGRFGVLVPRGDVQALGRAMLETLRQPSEKLSLIIDAGKLRALEFSPHAIAKRWVSFVSSLY